MSCLRATLAAAIAAAALCCGFLATDIGDIVDNARKYDGRTVTIAGEVTESTNLFVLKYYVLRDDTGEIMVVTENAVPEKGASMRVTGVVDRAFSFGDTNVVVLKEH